jgi:hypothetical protein
VLAMDVCGSNTTGGGGGTFWVWAKASDAPSIASKSIPIPYLIERSIRLEGNGDCTLSAAKLNGSPRRSDIELCMVEQCEIDLAAHRSQGSRRKLASACSTRRSRCPPPPVGKSLILLVPGERIELPTNGLQNRCSTAELTRRTWCV